MDVHKPKLVRNWREFLKEYGIIVLGVLTALLAEQAVQSFEWHQKIDAAVADMDNELGSGDGPEAYTRLAIHDCVSTHLDNLQASIERGDRSESRKLIDTLWLPNRTWDSLAREGATASDVSEHMPHGRMLEYRIAYEMVPDMQRLAEKELSDLGHLRALPTTGGPIGTDEKLVEDDAVEALKLDNDTFARESKFLLFRLRRMGLGLDRTFVERNVGAARAHYGNCITSPRLAPATPGGLPASMPLD
jgi:hypothetical protein